jgi:hypothetical protein
VDEAATRRLIVLRGSTASGTTTVALALQQALGPRTANIGQDHFRRVVLRQHEVPGGDNIGLIAHTVHYCASIDDHVIVEGIFRASRYGDMLTQDLAEHPGPTHVFYLDLLGVPCEIVLDGGMGLDATVRTIVRRRRTTARATAQLRRALLMITPPRPRGPTDDAQRPSAGRRRVGRRRDRCRRDRPSLLGGLGHRFAVEVRFALERSISPQLPPRRGPDLVTSAVDALR